MTRRGQHPHRDSQTRRRPYPTLPCYPPAIKPHGSSIMATTSPAVAIAYAPKSAPEQKDLPSPRMMRAAASLCAGPDNTPQARGGLSPTE